jgi:hypothetical protein
MSRLIVYVCNVCGRGTSVDQPEAGLTSLPHLWVESPDGRQHGCPKQQCARLMRRLHAAVGAVGADAEIGGV